MMQAVNHSSISQLLMMDMSTSGPVVEGDTMNGSTVLYPVDVQDKSPGFWQIPQITLIVLLLLFIVVGNLCVLLAIRLSETGRKTRMNFFIMHLAVSDLLVGVILVTSDLWDKIVIDWTIGDFFCRFREFLKSWVLIASTYVLVSLSIDRFDAIARPMNFSRRAFRARVLIYAAWIMAAIFSVPMFVVFGVQETNMTFHGVTNMTYCSPVKLYQPWHRKLYVLSLAIVAFFFPALIITVCYSVIIFIICNKSKSQMSSSQQRSIPLGNPAEGSESVVHHIGTTSNVIQQAKTRTIKMTFIIVLVFVLCWSPFFVFLLVQVFYLNNQPSLSDDINGITTLMMSLAPLNSAVNPVIYGVFSTRICRNLRRIPGLHVLSKYICCCCEYKRHRTVSRMSHTSFNDGTAHTDASTKYAFRSCSGVRRTLSETDNSSFILGRYKHGYSIGHQSHGKGPNNVFLFKPCSLYRRQDEEKSEHRHQSSRKSSGYHLVRRSLSQDDCNLLKMVSSKYTVRQVDSNC